MIKTEYGFTTIKGSKAEIVADVAVIVCSVCKNTPIDVKLIVEAVKAGLDEAYGGVSNDTLRS